MIPATKKRICYLATETAGTAASGLAVKAAATIDEL
jgi:hypothetical protein